METYRGCALHIFDFQVPSLFNGVFYIFKHPRFSQQNQFINLVLIKAWRFDKKSYKMVACFNTLCGIVEGVVAFLLTRWILACSSISGGYPG